MKYKEGVWGHSSPHRPPPQYTPNSYLRYRAQEGEFGMLKDIHGVLPGQLVSWLALDRLLSQNKALAKLYAYPRWCVRMAWCMVARWEGREWLVSHTLDYKSEGSRI